MTFHEFEQFINETCRFELRSQLIINLHLICNIAFSFNFGNF